MSDIQADLDSVQKPITNSVKTELARGVVEIVFTKVDGTTRILQGTLHASLLPVINISEHTRTIENVDVCRVFDIEKQAWRSFKYSSLQSYTLKSLVE